MNEITNDLKKESNYEYNSYTFDSILNNFSEYFQNIPNELTIIAKHGWFIDLEHSDLMFPNKIANYFKNKQIEKANYELSNYYSTNIKRIFETLISRHKERIDIFESILKCYYDKNYNVIIPTLLTQIDGICYDITKTKFFIRYNNHPAVLNTLNNKNINIMKIYLAPITETIPIIKNERESEQFICDLNRHEIIHGTRITYGSKINSLKIISLIKYISDILHDLE